MMCLSCYSYYPDTLASCPVCGTPAGKTERPSLNNAVAQMEQPNVYEPPKYKKRELLKLTELRSIRRDLKAIAVLLYIQIAFNLFLCFFMKDYDILIDIGILLVLALLVRYKQSRVAAFLICCYTVVNFYLAFRITGKPNGWLLIVTAFYAMSATFRFQRIWKYYKATGKVEYNPPTKYRKK
ncbi:MAG: hypothetical protein IJ711_03655 [Lachnospiraceae bacterium]|nr:hypothetical protein [Lachnospiraceae bacterium]